MRNIYEYRKDRKGGGRMYATSLILLGIIGNILISGCEGLEREEKYSVYLILTLVAVVLIRRFNVGGVG